MRLSLSTKAGIHTVRPAGGSPQGILTRQGNLSRGQNPLGSIYLHCSAWLTATGGGEEDWTALSTVTTYKRTYKTCLVARFQFSKVDARSAPTTSVILLLFCYRCIKQKGTGWMHKSYLKLLNLNLDSLLCFCSLLSKETDYLRAGTDSCSASQKSVS